MIKLSDLTITIRARSKSLPLCSPSSEPGRIGTISGQYIVFPEPFTSRALQLARLAQNEARKKAAPKVKDERADIHG